MANNTPAKPATKVASKPASKAVNTKAVAKPVASKSTKTTAAAKPTPAAKAISKSIAQNTAAAQALKSATKPAAKTTVITKSIVKTAPPKKDKEDKKAKAEKVKMERDSFTMPKDEYALIAALKGRMIMLGYPVKKSELLRAGIKLLAAMSDNTLKMTMEKIPVIKTGRPKK